MFSFPLRKSWTNEISSNDRNCTSFPKEYKIVSLCFPEYVKTETVSTFRSAFRYPFVCSLFLQQFSLSWNDFLISWSHNLLYIINPVHALLIKTICYLIWFVLIRRGYIIGHKAQMENSISHINWYEYLDSTEDIC